MIAAAVDGKIHLISTKSLSRFAHNTAMLLYLKNKGVGIFFQREDKEFKADVLSGFLFELGDLDLTDTEWSDSRFRAEEEKYKRLTAERKRMEAESVAIGGMLTELAELDEPPIEFDEKLWHAVVDRVTVYNDDRPVYSLKDGIEITVML